MCSQDAGYGIGIDYIDLDQVLNELDDNLEYCRSMLIANMWANRLCFRAASVQQISEGRT